MRNPLYVGNLLCWAGLGLLSGRLIAAPLAVLPLSNSALSAGTLTAALVGPAGLAGMLLAAGTVAGYVPAGPGALIVVAGVVGLATLTVTCARLATNVLGMLAGGRGRRFANLLTASAGLLLAAGAQLISFLMTRPTGWWENAADAMAWTPTTQLARAVTQAGTSPGAATAHLLAGLAVLPVLFLLLPCLPSFDCVGQALNPEP